MINQKEYSDLPAEQKLVYIKRIVVIGIVTLIPLIIVLVVGFSLMFSMAETLNELNENHTNSTALDEEIKDAEYTNEIGVYAIGLLLAFMIVILALIEAGSSYGNELANKLKLYTDLDVERLERKLAKIKEVKK